MSPYLVPAAVRVRRKYTHGLTQRAAQFAALALHLAACAPLRRAATVALRSASSKCIECHCHCGVNGGSDLKTPTSCRSTGGGGGR